MKKHFEDSELIINSDGTIFHLHLLPKQLADKVILVGDPGRVSLVAAHFEEKECEPGISLNNRKFQRETYHSSFNWYRL